MVKFGERMATEAVPQWAAAYVSYPRLTGILYDFEAKFEGAAQPPTLAQKQALEREILEAIDAELARADEHFVTVIEELEHRCILLRAHAASSPVEGATPLTRRSFNGPPSPGFGPQGYGSLNDPERAPLSGTEAKEPRRHVSFAGAAPAVGGGSSDGGTSESRHVSFSLSVDGPAPEKSDYQDWFHTAESLERFSQLCSEAVRKATKKVEKSVHGVKVKHLALASVERRQLFDRVGELQTMIQLVKLEYGRRYRTHLDQSEDVEIVAKPRWQPNLRMIMLAVAIFVVVLWMPLGLAPEAHNCLALFSLIITLWITEAFPYFATALLIPLVAVPLQVLRDPDTRHPAEASAAAHLLLSKMFENVQILVLGGLTMAKALDKSQLAATAEAFLHARTARYPHLYMAGVMGTACILCIFVSNVAAPVLMLGVIRRTLLRMPRGENRAAPQRAMLLGLAFACNLGGMLSPIASPQNAVALRVLAAQNVNVSFAAWVVATAPFVAVMLVAAWGLLLQTLRPFEHMEFVPLPDAPPANSGSLTRAQRLFVTAICGLTCFMWCADPDGFFGGPAMVALIPIVAFFGFGILEKDDFNTLSWHLMFLLAGGSMLGLCAQSSGLLKAVSHVLLGMLHGANAITVIAIVVVGVGIVTTFISHTVAAMVLLPLIGALQLPEVHGALAGGLGAHLGPVLIMVSVLMCSGAMAFPISSFPNVNSLLAEDELGQPWLAANDYILPGGILSAGCGALLILGEAWWVSMVL